MKEIHCIAIDDEPLALTIISNFCLRYGHIRLETFCEPRIGLEAIRQQHPDLVFLDIEMNSLSGLDIARTIASEIRFIFTTAHAQFAVDGFNLDAVDFLYKPFSYERFVQALEKTMRRIHAEEMDNLPETIIVKQEYNHIVIPIAEIYYIEAMENYIKIFRNNGSTILSKNSMKSMQAMLPEKDFIRIHKSFLVAYNNIESYNHHEVIVKNPKVRALPIGRTYVTEFRKQMAWHRLRK